MAYRLKPERPVADELTRVARKQLERAAAELTAAGVRLRPERVHGARKRVKKVRALLRLAAPCLPHQAFRRTNEDLQSVSRQLGRVTDAGAARAAFDRLVRRHSRAVPRRVVAALHVALHERDIDMRRNARRKKISAKCEHVLLTEARRLKGSEIRAHGIASLAPGLAETERRARRKMKVAWRHPDADRLHAWRRRVKDEWLQLRLMGGAAGPFGQARCEQLEKLDGVLGEYHDLALLRRAIEEEDPLTREQTAAVLRIIVRDRQRLRRQARSLAEAIYGEAAA